MRSRLILLAVAVGLILAADDDGCCETTEQVAEIVQAHAANHLRVMSFNVFHDAKDDKKEIPGWGGRRQTAINLIKFEDPDVIGLQEALGFQVLELVGRAPAVWFLRHGSRRGASG